MTQNALFASGRLSGRGLAAVMRALCIAPLGAQHRPRGGAGAAESAPHAPKNGFQEKSAVPLITGAAPAGLNPERSERRAGANRAGAVA